MDEILIVVAELNLFKGPGMRQVAISSGYRPIFKFNGLDTLLSGSIQLLNGEKLLPGQSQNVEISFHKNIIGSHLLKPDSQFEFFEENRQMLGNGHLVG